MKTNEIPTVWEAVLAGLILGFAFIGFMYLVEDIVGMIKGRKSHKAVIAENENLYEELFNELNFPEYILNDYVSYFRERGEFRKAIREAVAQLERCAKDPNDDEEKYEISELSVDDLALLSSNIPHTKVVIGPTATTTTNE